MPSLRNPRFEFGMSSRLSFNQAADTRFRPTQRLAFGIIYDPGHFYSFRQVVLSALDIKLSTGLSRADVRGLDATGPISPELVRGVYTVRNGKYVNRTNRCPDFLRKKAIGAGRIRVTCGRASIPGTDVARSWTSSSGLLHFVL